MTSLVKWDPYSIVNDPQLQMILRLQMIPKMDGNDPGPQIIPIVDGKWSGEK